MNRYQREVAEMDRRRNWVIRALSVLGAASFIVIALWGAGVSPSAWWARLRAAMMVETDSLQSAVRAEPMAASPMPVQSKPEGQGSLAPVPDQYTLVLFGTAPGRNRGEGTAQIGWDGENRQTYVGGAILANGARLDEIHADHVVLEHGGERASLYLASLRRTPPASNLIEVKAAAPAELPSAPHATQPQLTDVIRTSPQFADDVLAGVQVFPGRNRGVYAQLGLQSGDVIVAIEGAPVSDADAVLTSLQALFDGAAVTVTVRRGAEYVSVALDGAVVASAIAAADRHPSAGVMAGPASPPN